MKCTEEQEGFLETNKVLISQCSTKIVFQDSFEKQTEFYPHCKFCKNLSQHNIYISKNSLVRHLVCSWCSPIVDSDFLSLNDVKENGLSIIADAIEYSCIWNFGSFYNLKDISLHEMDCKKMS